MHIWFVWTEISLNSPWFLCLCPPNWIWLTYVNAIEWLMEVKGSCRIHGYIYDLEEEQNISPQKMSLWCRLLWAKDNQAQYTQKELFTSPVTVWNDLGKGKDLSPWLFSSFCELSSFPLKPQSPTSFFLAQNGICLNYLITERLTFLWDFLTYKICFSLVNLFYVNLIIRPTEEPREEKRKVSAPTSQTIWQGWWHLHCWTPHAEHHMLQMHHCCHWTLYTHALNTTQIDFWRKCFFVVNFYFHSKPQTSILAGRIFRKLISDPIIFYIGTILKYIEKH